KIQDLLNATICDGVRIAAVISEDPNRVHVGHGLARPSLITEPFLVRVGRQKASCSLDISYRLSLDRERQYLTVVSSFFGIYANDQDRSCLCQFDYERDKAGGYPEAHLQVPGVSAALTAMSAGRTKRSLDRLHFPVGGRTYRPVLEDVIEFLIVEKLARPREDSWRDVLNREREGYYHIQLQAAIRRNPELARQALRGLDVPVVSQRLSKRGSKGQR